MRKRMQQALQLGVFSLALTCTACGQDTAGPLGEVTEANVSPPTASEASKTLASADESLDLQIQDAVADLAGRTGVAVDAITVNQARSVNWGSGALGCPKEGMNYTQAIVPGILLLLEADGKIYRYHGGDRGELFYCPDDRAEAPAYGPGQEVM